jgi:DNA-binding transcriptional MerR regulator
MATLEKTGEITEHVLGNINEPIEQEHALFVDEALKKELNNIPDKMAFKIGEVAELLDIKTYVLRYWETEFDALKPKKSSHNQRMYTRKDVETALFIKKLLYKDRFSIEGARKALRKVKTEVKTEVKKDKALFDSNAVFTEAVADIKSLLKQVQTLKVRFE